MKRKNTTLLAVASLAALSSLLTISASNINSSTTNMKWGEDKHDRRQGGHIISEIARGRMKGEMKDFLVSDLAIILGVSKDSVLAQLNAGKNPHAIILASGLNVVEAQVKLDELRDARMRTQIASDVTSGKITQIQADSIIEKMTTKKIQEEKHRNEMIARVASIIGITKDQVKSDLDSGKTVEQIAVAHGVTTADFKIKMEAVHMSQLKANLAKKVLAGKITQAEADKILSDGLNFKGKGRLEKNNKKIFRGHGHTKITTSSV